MKWCFRCNTQRAREDPLSRVRDQRRLKRKNNNFVHITSCTYSKAKAFELFCNKPFSTRHRQLTREHQRDRFDNESPLSQVTSNDEPWEDSFDFGNSRSARVGGEAAHEEGGCETECQRYRYVHHVRGPIARFVGWIGAPNKDKIKKGKHGWWRLP